MKKPLQQNETAGSHFPQQPTCPVTEMYPLLYEHLTCSVWDDQSPRQTSTLSISTSDGRFLLVLRDRAVSKVLFTSGGTLTDALESLENNLGLPDAPWRKDNFDKMRGKK